MNRFWCGLAVFVAVAVASATVVPASAQTIQSTPEKNPAVARSNSAAIALFKRGDYQGALSALDGIIQRFPESGLAYANRGGVYFQIKKYDEAIKDYTQAIGLGRNDTMTVLDRASAYSKNGEFDRALDDCNAIIRINPRNAVAYRVCGVAWQGKGDNQKAFADLDESVRLDPRAAKTFRARAIAYEQAGLADKARADIAQAGRLDPSSVTQAALAEARERAGAAAPAAMPQPKPAQQLTPAVAPPVVAAAPQNDPAPPVTASDAPGGETRVALVIGNSDYVSVPRLPNPQHDAAAVADALRAAGFKTVRLDDNLGAPAMRQALNEFSAEAAQADWALVYYAGHGIEVNGTNYLIPVDAKLKTDRAVQFEAVPLDAVLASVEGARKLHLVILDACRDNPFLRDMARTVTSRSVGRGLARIEPDASATLVAYSAKAGQTAMDGTDGQDNSPFARAVIRNMQRPGVEIRKFFGLVRDDVMAATGNSQEPFVYGSLGGDDYFLRKP
ncbi:caspase family protein [Bradyrhizobium tropiciagri]|uniref:caspase family protein n=1 Tax=Bradyrhizobium tropiciagri TaxID=312253 RepID=UPI001BA5C456|nr:caspase family protein [Bradyrhizobium tropiciagri]MBR0895340.1 caspase family protein [Bradyrhizobium tropiciagri]